MKTKIIASLLAGILIGAILTCPAAAVKASDTVTAHISSQPVYVDGKQANLTAYLINGSNYVKLRDIGKAVDFNVYWDGAVQIESGKPYTGKAPAATPTLAAAPTPAPTQADDVDVIRQEMIQRINAVRKENGVAELPVNQALMDAAQDISTKGFLTHDRYEWESMAAHGWPYGGAVNMTVFSYASDTDIAERAVRNWYYSNDHLQTMISDRAACLGVGMTLTSGVSGKAYCTMIVGDPNGRSPL